MHQMKESALDDYAKERESLSADEIDEILTEGKKWNLSQTLKEGGSALFPHTYIKECGYQTAAVVHGCLDSGADQVLALGVLHPLTGSLRLARLREMYFQDVTKESARGILGPGTGLDRAWTAEFSLLSFLFLWSEEVKRRGIESPELIIRYPYLVNREPEKVPGIEELQSIAKDSVVVATSDLCHHGLAYGHAADYAFDISDEGELFARDQIQKGLDLLEHSDYKSYYQHCLQTKSDSLDVCTVLRHLLGPLRGTILDLNLVDASDLYDGAPQPSWVAASLVELKRTQR